MIEFCKNYLIIHLFRKEKLSQLEERQLEEAAEAVVKASLAIDEARLTVQNISNILDKLSKRKLLQLNDHGIYVYILQLKQILC